MPLTDHSVLYGGSFDPPHSGHLIASMWLIDALNARQVIMVPTYQHAFGKNLTDFEHRKNMCELAVDILPKNKIIVSDVEKHLPHPNLTLHTVRHFKNHGIDKIAIAIGSDLLDELDRWEGWQEVLGLAKVAVIGRSGTVRPQHSYPIYEYPIDLSAISSTDIRKRILRDKDITGLVSKRVKEYIVNNNLYK